MKHTKWTCDKCGADLNEHSVVHIMYYTKGEIHPIWKDFWTIENVQSYDKHELDLCHDCAGCVLRIVGDEGKE